MAVTVDVIRVLLVEDDEDDYFITSQLLRPHHRFQYDLQWESHFDSAVRAIAEQAHDIYLVDYRLGARTGLEVIRAGFAARPRAPVIMLTGQADYEADLEATSLGVTDFLLKQELNEYSLERAIRYALHQHRILESLELTEQRYALAARAVNDGIWDWDLNTDQVYYSPRWNALLGLPEAQTSGTPADWFDLVHPDDTAGLQLAIEAHLSGRTSVFSSKHRLRHASGAWRWMLARGVAVTDATASPTRMAGSLSDITVSRQTERQLQHDALHDPLTGLPNRALFMDLVSRAILREQRPAGRSPAVIFLDIDRFKFVNDTFSHSVGDHLLVSVAKRIAGELRPSDTVARISGDEFTILLDDIPEADAGAYAAQVASRVLASLDREVTIDGNKLFVTASCGIALWSGGTNAADLVRNADIAMYEAKHRGRNRHALFDRSMHERIVERLALQSALRRVVEFHALEVHYQPVVDLVTGELHGFEALARWPRGRLQPEGVSLGPDEFIPIAEEMDLIGSLGRQVMEVAVESLARWRRNGVVDDTVRMSVNVSGRQLDDPSFPASVLDILGAADLPGRLLCLEITEGTLMTEPERISIVAEEVCSRGVGLQLDDFGTGYSSLAALHRFPVNALKIDKSFISSMAEGAEATAIVRSTIALGRSLGLDLIAEGIEHHRQLGELRFLGCQFGQGYLFARPLEDADVEAWVMQQRRGGPFPS